MSRFAVPRHANLVPLVAQFPALPAPRGVGEGFREDRALHEDGEPFPGGQVPRGDEPHLQLPADGRPRALLAHPGECPLWVLDPELPRQRGSSPLQSLRGVF